MAKWHQLRVADLTLRGSGLCSLTLGWFLGLGLYRDIHAHRLHQASLGELGRCAILVVSVLAGNVLLVIGARLWTQVQAPGRRSIRLPGDASFDPSIRRDLLPAAPTTRPVRYGFARRPSMASAIGSRLGDVMKSGDATLTVFHACKSPPPR